MSSVDKINQMLKELEETKKRQKSERQAKMKQLREAKRIARREAASKRRADRAAARAVTQKSRKALGSLIRDFVRKPTDKNHKDVLAAMKEWKKLKG